MVEKRTRTQLYLAMALITLKVSTLSVDSVLFTRAAHKMQTYEWFLSQVMYPWSMCLILWPIVLVQRWRGQISDLHWHGVPENPNPASKWAWDAWDPSKRGVAILGLASGLGNLVSTFPSAYLPGAFYTLLGKLVIPVYMFLSYFLLGTRYGRTHFAGAALVLVGVTVAIWQDLDLPDSDGTWTIFLAVGKCFMGFGILQQYLTQGGDIPVLYFRASYAAWECLSGLLLVPTVFIQLPNRTIVEPSTLFSYIGDSFACLMGTELGPSGACPGTFWLWVGYMAVNVVFNLCYISVIKYFSSVTNEASSCLATPIEIALYTYRPLAGVAYDPQGFSSYTIVAAILVVSGNMLYVSKQETPTKVKQPPPLVEELAPGESLLDRAASALAPSSARVSSLGDPLLALGPRSSSVSYRRLPGVEGGGRAASSIQ